MDQNDIICCILDIFRNNRDAESIKTCMQLNKQWHACVLKNVKTCLKTLEMWTFLWNSQKTFQQKMTKEILNFIESCNFHSRLNSNLRSDTQIVQSLMRWVPNYKSNHLLIDPNIAPEIHDRLLQTIGKYISIEHFEEYEIKNLKKLQITLVDILTKSYAIKSQFRKDTFQAYYDNNCKLKESDLNTENKILTYIINVFIHVALLNDEQFSISSTSLSII